MVVNNFPATPRGDKPNERQKQPFSNVLNRQNTFGVMENEFSRPDQTPSLTATEEAHKKRDRVRNSHDMYADSDLDLQEYTDDFSDLDDSYEEYGDVGQGIINPAAEKALKQAQFKANLEKGSNKSNFFSNQLDNGWMSVQKRLKIVDAIEKAKAIFKDEGEEITTQELSEALKTPPNKPSFPIEIVTAALIKDILDVPLEVGGVPSGLTTTFIGQVVSVLMGVVLFFWTFNKISGWFGYKKKLIRWALKGLAFTFVIELIPFLRIIPANTVFVLMAHYRETKTVKLMLLALDVINQKGGLKKIENVFGQKK